MAERPEYPETKEARRKAWAWGFLAVGFAALVYVGGVPEAAPYTFTFFFSAGSGVRSHGRGRSSASAR